MAVFFLIFVPPLEKMREMEARHDRGDEGDSVKLTYEESFRRHAESLREHYRAEWIAYHKAAAQQLKRTLWRLVKEHEEETARLERGLSA